MNVQHNEGSTMALSDLENLVLAKLAAHSKPHGIPAVGDPRIEP